MLKFVKNDIWWLISFTLFIVSSILGYFQYNSFLLGFIAMSLHSILTMIGYGRLHYVKDKS